MAVERLTLPSNLSDLLNSARSLDPKQPPRAPILYTPSSAVKLIESERSKRNFASNTTLELLGLQEEYTSRIGWLAGLGRPVPPSDRRKLADVQRELRLDVRRGELVSAQERFTTQNKLVTCFPAVGDHRRELYPKHIEFMVAGRTYRSRLAMFANRVGKTFMAAVECTYHATGLYPDWWEGKVFDKPLLIWVCNKGAKEVRDINENELYGRPGDVAARGTGMIPAHRLVQVKPKTGVQNGIEFGYVRHVSGGKSTIQSKSFDQGRESFQGAAPDVIWLDEECPEDVYGECLLRTMTNDGIIILTYTPIKGMTPLTSDFMRDAGIEIDGQPLTSQEKVA